MYEASVIVSGGESTAALRQALAEVLREPCARRMEIVVVTETGVPIDAGELSDIECTPHVIKVVLNQFTPGRTGSRRTGILASTATVITFYDEGGGRELGRQRAALAHNT